MRHVARLLLRPRPLQRQLLRFFCEEQKKPPVNQQPSTLGKIGQIAKKAWRTTFPDESEEVKKRFQDRKKKALETPKLTEEELEQLQLSIPQERRSALVETKVEPKKEKKGLKQKLIPEAVRNKIKESDAYKKYQQAQKEISEFKEDLKEYIGSKDNVAFQAATVVYGKVSRGSDVARAIEYMRQIDSDFDPETLDAESTEIFIEAYESFLRCEIHHLDRLCGDQALDFFKSHITMYRTKKIKPKFTKVWDHNPSHLNSAKMDDKGAPTFVFRIELQEIYCFEDLHGKIVDGDEQRLNRCTFQFGMKATGKGLEENGHNWQITEVQKIEEVKMLV